MTETDKPERRAWLRHDGQIVMLPRAILQPPMCEPFPELDELLEMLPVLREVIHWRDPPSAIGNVPHEQPAGERQTPFHNPTAGVWYDFQAERQPKVRIFSSENPPTETSTYKWDTQTHRLHCVGSQPDGYHYSPEMINAQLRTGWIEITEPAEPPSEGETDDRQSWIEAWEEYRSEEPEKDLSARWAFKAGWDAAARWLIQRAEQAEREREKLRAAIKKHHDQKADDRCWMDDDELYQAAGYGLANNKNRFVGDKAAMLKNCERFIERRCGGGHWPTYVELEQQLAAANKRTVASVVCPRCEGRQMDSIGCNTEHGKENPEPCEFCEGTGRVGIRKLQADNDRLRAGIAARDAVWHDWIPPSQSDNFGTWIIRASNIIQRMKAATADGAGQELLDDLEKLRKFNQYVHDRLDKAGVPASFPEGKHGKEGCRIGDRLDWVFDLLKELRSVNADLRSGNAMRALEVQNDQQAAELERLRKEMTEAHAVLNDSGAAKEPLKGKLIGTLPYRIQQQAERIEALGKAISNIAQAFTYGWSIQTIRRKVDDAERLLADGKEGGK